MLDMTDAAIYVRISDDREGSALGIARQEQDCRALAASIGWNVLDVYADHDPTAFIVRPASWKRSSASARPTASTFARSMPANSTSPRHPARWPLGSLEPW